MRRSPRRAICGRRSDRHHVGPSSVDLGVGSRLAGTTSSWVRSEGFREAGCEAGPSKAGGSCTRFRSTHRSRLAGTSSSGLIESELLHFLADPGKRSARQILLHSPRRLRRLDPLGSTLRRACRLGGEVSYSLGSGDAGGGSCRLLRSARQGSQ